MIKGEAFHPPVASLFAVLPRKSTHPLLTKFLERLSYKFKGCVNKENYGLVA
jgi:hypothetical protein